VSEQLSQSEVRRLIAGEHVPKRKVRHSHPPQAKGKKRERGTMNKTEKRYAAELDRQYRAGLIQWYGFEAVKIRLADNTFLTPDFAVLEDSGLLELHDVKGRKGDGYWCEEDAKLKLKVLAEHFPAIVKIVWEDKSGAWQSETL